MTNVLVTGGAGFIGSTFVRRLFEADRDAHITVLDALTYAGNLENIPQQVQDSGRFTFVHGSINDAETVRELIERTDQVVHFAAETHVARSLESDRVFFETDVLGTQCLANAVVRWGRNVERFVHISSSEVYGTAENPVMDEEHALNPTSPYAAAKAGADRLVYSYIETYDMPAIIVRPFNNYGPRQHLEKVIPRFITSLLLGEPLTVHGNGDAARDWIHVDDTARGIDLIRTTSLETVRGEVFNLGTGVDCSVLELAERLLAAASNTKSEISYMDDRIGQVVRHTASTDKSANVLGFTTQISLEDGLATTMQWYEDNPDAWKSQVSLREVEIQLPNGRVVRY